MFFRLILLMFVSVSILSTEVYGAVYALAGDSTVAPNDGNDGWGDALGDFLSAEDTVINHARGGRSTKSFINEDRWQNVLELKPDYILIQFGHNDQKLNNATIAAHAFDSPKHPLPTTDLPKEINTVSDAPGAIFYRANLRRMINDAQAIGATPILITPVARRTTPFDNAQAQVDWNATNQASDDLGNSYSLLDYAKAVKAVGLEKEVRVLDLNSLSLALYADMIANGQDISSLGPTGDNTHFNRTGMVAIAKLVANALNEETLQATEAADAPSAK